VRESPSVRPEATWPKRLPTSVVLHDLLGAASAERVTLGWLLGRLRGRSFGIVLLLLGLLPGLSAFVGVLLAVPACQCLARPGPVFPRRVSGRQFEV
jgi:hypothetical protein